LSDQKVGQRGEIGAPIVSTLLPKRSDERFEGRQSDYIQLVDPNIGMCNTQAFASFKANSESARA